MRTSIKHSTKINGFGIGQNRVVVVRDARGVHAAQHLAMWHASRLWHGLYEALLALKQAVAAAPAMPALCPAPSVGPVPSVGCPRSGDSMRPGSLSGNG